MRQYSIPLNRLQNIFRGVSFVYLSDHCQPINFEAEIGHVNRNSKSNFDELIKYSETKSMRNGIISSQDRKIDRRCHIKYVN